MGTCILTSSIRDIMRFLAAAALALLMAGSVARTARAIEQVGLDPVPDMSSGVGVDASMTLDALTGRYTYSYTITNPATNTGKIWYMLLGVRQPPDSQVYDASGLTILQMWNGSIVERPFESSLGNIGRGVPPGWSVVPFGLTTTNPGWHGALMGGSAKFKTFEYHNFIPPGQTLGGFDLISPGVPALRNMVLVPNWDYISDDSGLTVEEIEAEAEAASRVRDEIDVSTLVLGPSGVRLGSFAHWDQLRADLDKAIGLGWATDSAVAAALVSGLASARQALDAHDGTLAKERLGDLLDALSSAPSGAMRQEVRDLVYYNAQRLIEHTSDTVVPMEPAVTLTPVNATLPIDTEIVFSVSAVNLADASAPIAGLTLHASIEDGPHAGESFTFTTDAQGLASFGYTGSYEGFDKVIVGAGEGGMIIETYASALVYWKGGPDMVMEVFLPPLAKLEGGGTVKVSDITGNAGNASAGGSVTRYYLSTDTTIDPATDTPLGERAVPAIEAGAYDPDRPASVEVAIPAGLQPGYYYLGACADADDAVMELDEGNNCEPREAAFSVSTILPADASGLAGITDLKARAKSGKIDLTWTAVSGALYYNIYRRTSAEEHHSRIKEGHTTTYAAYEDAGLTNGVTYCYEVTWVESIGSGVPGSEAPDSNEACATPSARSR
jgi:hypothetical protein